MSARLNSNAAMTVKRRHATSVGALTSHRPTSVVRGPFFLAPIRCKVVWSPYTLRSPHRQAKHKGEESHEEKVVRMVGVVKEEGN